MALNAKRQAFVRQYLFHGNAAQAYREAGYSAPNAQTASAGAARLLADVSIRQAIEEGRQQARQSEIVTRDDILSGLKREAKRIRNGNAHARVAAWKLLAEMLGLLGDAQMQQMVSELMRRLDEREAQEAGGGSGPADHSSGTPPPA